jgi:hypothetical protein
MLKSFGLVSVSTSKMANRVRVPVAPATQLVTGKIFENKEGCGSRTYKPNSPVCVANRQVI